MKKILMLLIALFLSECSTQKFYLTEESVGPGLVATHESKANFFIYGLGQTKEVNAGQICGDRPIRMLETRYSFIDGLLSVITYGIYSPRTYAVYCGSNKKPKKTTSEDVE